jgi:hypothetical protein
MPIGIRKVPTRARRIEVEIVPSHWRQYLETE